MPSSKPIGRWNCLLGLLTILVVAGTLIAQNRTVVRLGSPQDSMPQTAPIAYSVTDFLRLSLENNPALAQAAYEIQAAQGRALQAGLYPNPTIGLIGEEIGRGGGIHTLPQFSQEIVTGKKLSLSRAVAEQHVGQAQLTLMRQRYSLFTHVRQGFFDLLALQQRVTMLTELVQVVGEAHSNAEKLLKAKAIPEIEYLPIRAEFNKLRGDLDATQRERLAAWRRLVAVVGVPQLPVTPVQGSLDTPLPPYNYEQSKLFVLEEHPEVQSARIGVTRARFALMREQAQVKPNVTLTGGYSRNFNDRENQATYGISIPVPVFNRNQGNIRASQAELAQAQQEVTRVQYDLGQRLAAAFGQFTAASDRARRYAEVRKDAETVYQYVRKGYPKLFDVFRLVQAQRALAEANLEYNRVLLDAWRAASEIAGLLLEDETQLLMPGGEMKK